MSSKANLGLFWDLENCQLPSDKSALAVVQHLRGKFGQSGSEVEFSCVCDVNKERIEIIDQLNEAQVSVIHVSSGVKNAADDKLKACLQKFGNTYMAPSTVVLISGDVNFSPILSDLRNRCGFYVVLVHGWPCQDALIVTSHEHFRFQQLLQDVPNVVPSSYPKKRCCYLRVSGLPDYAAPAKVKARLRQLSDNLGGRVLELKRNGTAVLQFASPEATIRGEKRMHNETVFGMKIVAQSAYSNPISTYKPRPVYSPIKCPSLPLLRASPFTTAYHHISITNRSSLNQSPPPPLLPPSSFCAISPPETEQAPSSPPVGSADNSSPLENLSEPDPIGTCSDLLESDTTETENEMGPPSQRQIMTDKLKTLLSCNKPPNKMGSEQGSRSQSPPSKSASDFAPPAPSRSITPSQIHLPPQRQNSQRYDNCPVDVRVDNLVVSNGHVRDMKKILWTKFAQFVQVRHVTIIPQTDGKWYALVQVANTHNGQKAVQYMNNAKINASRMRVTLNNNTAHDNTRPPKPISLRDEVISLLNQLPSKCIQLKKLIQLLKCICSQPLTLTDLYQMRDAVRLAENRSGVCFIRLTSKFQNELEQTETDAQVQVEGCSVNNEGDMVLAEQIVEVLLTNEGECVPLDEIDQAYVHRFNQHIPIAQLRVTSIRQLCTSMPNTLKLTRNASGRAFVRLSDCRQKSIRVQKIFYVFLRKPELEFTPENFARVFHNEFGTVCDPDKLKEEFPELLTWKQKPQGVLLLRLTDLQQFALRSRKLLIDYSTKDVPLGLYESEYQNRYGYRVCPQKYGYPSLIGLLRAASHVLYLKGRGARSTITINRNFLSSLLCLKDHVRIPTYPTPRAQQLLNRHKWHLSQTQDNWDDDLPSGVEQLDEETRTQLGFVFKRNNHATRRPWGRKIVRGMGRGMRTTQVWRRKTTHVHNIPRLQRMAEQVACADSSSTEEDETTADNEQLFDVKLEEYSEEKVVEIEEKTLSEPEDEQLAMSTPPQSSFCLLPPAYFASPMKDSGVGSVHGSTNSEDDYLSPHLIKRPNSKASSIGSVVRGRCRLALKFTAPM